MIKKVGAVVWRSSKVQDMLNFYRTIGIPLDHDTHEGEGHTPHYEADLAGVHYALFESLEDSTLESNTDTTLIGFEVDNLISLMSKLAHMNVKFRNALEQTPWGKRIVVFDPDGRPVELYQP